MTKKKFYPNTYASSTGGKFQPFKKSTLKNLHTKTTTTYAETELIHGKKQPINRPGTVTVSNFKCGLPTGSLVTKVTVYYAHSKVEYNKKVCNIPAPTISLMNGDKVLKYSKKSNVQNINVSDSSMEYVDPSVYEITAVANPMSKKGKAPTTKITTGSITYNSSWDYTLINSDKFGVRVNYPTNANNEEGYMRLYYVYVELEYKAPDYTLKCLGAEGNTGYNGDDYTVAMELSNLNSTKYVTTVILTAPAGFTYQDCMGNGTIEKVQNQVYRWTPKMINGTMSIALRFNVNVTIPSGGSYTGTFTAREQLLGKQSPHTATITPKPKTVDTLPEDNPNQHVPSDDLKPTVDALVYVREKEVFTLGLGISKEEYDEYVAELEQKGSSYNYCNFKFELFKTPEFSEETETSSTNLRFEDPVWQSGHPDSEWDGTAHYLSTPFTWDIGYQGEDSFYNGWPAICINEGEYILKVSAVSPEQSHYPDQIVLAKTLKICCYPENVTTPSISILQLSSEELNRLGHAISYIIHSHMKITTSKSYVPDWQRNFRIGVFNNAISDNISIVTIPPEDENDDPTEIVVDTTDYDNLTFEEIFNNAEYWSDALNTPNSYENVECKFPYNKNYPLYIILAGDYPEANPKGVLSYTEPCIIEESYYDGREPNGTYPIPIENTKNGDGDFAELNINSLGTASPVIYYDLPFDEDYGTNENTAIRGIEVSGVIEQNTDDINIYAKLKAPTGESRTRSLNLDALDTNVNSDNRFVLGGMGDLWGLSTLDIKNLEDWEIEFMVDNTINNNTGTLNFSDVSLTVYISEIDSQNISCKVENEDISYYGAFLKDVEIPEGLKTDVDYLTIDGTDTNDPYRQNIREKEITLKLDIGDNCDLTASTLSLRDLARLFQNKRDKYNRPIPKRIEFSHYPDVYWEYIMEDTFDNPIEISSYDDVKIKLTVPLGTAYKKQATSSNKVGYVNGLANVSPVIVVKPTDNILTITETLTEQNFHMGYSGDLTDKVIVIDCEDRIVWLKSDEDDEDGENITYSVDFNSDWFSIIEEYQFDSTGCVIKDVSYIERW